MGKAKKKHSDTHQQAQTWKEAIRQNTRERPQTVIALRRRWAPYFSGFCIFTILLCIGLLSWNSRDVLADLQKRVLLDQAEGDVVREIEFSSDGVLTEGWVKRELNLFEDAFPLDADIFALQRDLETVDQIKSATVKRSFAEASLSIRVEERDPVFKMMIATDGGRVARLVDNEGVLFSPHGFSRAQLRRLPWLGGVNLVEVSQGFAPISEIDRLLDVLERTEVLAPQLFSDIQVVQIEPRSKLSPLLGENIVFRTSWCERLVLSEGDLDEQLIDLDTVVAEFPGDWASVGSMPMALIDLTMEGYAVVKASPRRADRARSPAPYSIL